MAVFPIRQFGDPVLRQKAKPVETVTDEIRKLIRDLTETMRAAPGVGLAAPQIGIPKRVIVWEFEGDSGALVNPEVVEGNGSEVDEEGCLSLPGLSYEVERAERVRVEGTGEDGGKVSFEAYGMKARIIQHEVDHLDGVLFIDRLDPQAQKDARRRLREIAMGAPAATEAPAI
jgi:peptide deformylase